jgi:hypothetical protein
MKQKGIEDSLDNRRDAILLGHKQAPVNYPFQSYFREDIEQLRMKEKGKWHVFTT